MDAPDDWERAIYEKVRGWMSDDLRVIDVELSDDSGRLALASLLLHGRPGPIPGGFTWEDVDNLRSDTNGGWLAPWKDELATRIAALLPPRNQPHREEEK